MGSIAGKIGHLLVAGRVAARLANWTLDHRGENAIIHAQIRERDIYWLEHASQFDLRLDFGKCGLRWRDVKVAVIGNSVRIEAHGKPGGG